MIWILSKFNLDTMEMKIIGSYRIQSTAMAARLLEYEHSDGFTYFEITEVELK